MNIIHGIPSGGGANYVLSKNSADDFDVSWKQSQYVGKNLLINSDFRFPVNQQGKLTYTVTDELKMTVDMWVKYGGTNYTIDVTSDGLQITPNAAWVGIETRVEGFYLTPGNYIFSFVISNPSTTLNRSFHTIIIGTSYDGTNEILVNVSGSTLLPNAKVIYIVNFTVTKQYKYIRVVIGAGNSTATNPFIITACKLEKGNFQTLCYDGTTEIIENPPNLTDELIKCERYFKKITKNATYPAPQGKYPITNGAILIPLNTPLYRAPDNIGIVFSVNSEFQYSKEVELDFSGSIFLFNEIVLKYINYPATRYTGFMFVAVCEETGYLNSFIQ